MATRKPGKIRGARQRKRFRPRAWSRELGFVEEPLLEFAHGQTAEHPRDGLYLYGPVAGQADPVPIDYGVIGTEEGLARFDGWAKEVSLAIPRHVPKLNPDALHHITFPGFEAAFNTRWPVQPAARITVDSTKVSETILIGNRAEGIKKTVDLFVEPLVAFADRQEVAPKFWFVVVPEVIYRYGRPNQVVPKTLRTQGTINISRARAQEALAAPSLFPEHDEGADIYEYGLDFRRQLKARLLGPRIVTQLVRETTIAPVAGRPVEDPATIAWKLCTTAYYKAGGQPWRLANVRPGVCYVGLVFKQTDPGGDEANACCAAQMFLASGDGIVFRGALGPWYTPSRKEFHLTRVAAKQLIEMVIEAYKAEHGGEGPKELFLHGKARFSKDEWEGFREGVPGDTRLVCVQIKPARNEIKVFRGGRYPVVRGTVWKLGDRTAYLWTSGYVPRLDTYIGPETPNPMFVNVHWGVSGRATPPGQGVRCAWWRRPRASARRCGMRATG